MSPSGPSHRPRQCTRTGLTVRGVRVLPRWWTFLCCVGLLACLATGCVERRFLIETNPPGAVVEVNGRRVGSAPVNVPIAHYGIHRIRIFAPGYQTLVVDQPIDAPWYEYFPIDFVSENLIPYTFRDIRRQRYDLIPEQVASPDDLLDRSSILRNQGLQLQGDPLPNGGAPPSASPSVPQLSTPRPVPQQNFGPIVTPGQPVPSQGIPQGVNPRR